MSIRKFWRGYWRVTRHTVERHDRLADRERLAARVNAYARNGQIGLIYGGMDCDCSRFERATVLAAVPRLVERFIDRFHESAEGPQYAYAVTPIEACAHTAWSRDLALEAFEDGHPHHIHV
jgi:hypothetical protein